MLHLTYHLPSLTHGAETRAWTMKDASTKAVEMKFLQSSINKG